MGILNFYFLFSHFTWYELWCLATLFPSLSPSTLTLVTPSYSLPHISPVLPSINFPTIDLKHLYCCLLLLILIIKVLVLYFFLLATNSLPCSLNSLKSLKFTTNEQQMVVDLTGWGIRKKYCVSFSSVCFSLYEPYNNFPVGK